MSIGVSETQSDAVGTESHHRAFLGWQIVAVAFLAQFVASGVTLSAIGNFVGPVSADLGIPDSAVGMAPALAILVIGLVGPLLGRWLDRGWTRRVMLAGALLAGGGLILLARVSSAWQLALVYVGLVCVGGALFGALPATTLVANWFVRRRGLMLGIAFAGATVASYVAPAFAQAVIDAEGWRSAVRYLGIFTLVTVVPVFAFFIVSRPEAVGQRPDGDPSTPSSPPLALPDENPDTKDSTVPAEPDSVAPDGAGSPSMGVGEVDPGSASTATDAGDGIPLRSAAELARDPRLWLVAIGFGLVMTSPVVMIGMLVPFGMSLGFTGQQATLFFGAMAPFSLLGKVVVGGLADVTPLKPSIAMIVSVILVVWMLLYSDPSFSVFVATGALYGVGIGGAAPLHGVLVGRCFGRLNFGTASGLGGLATIPLMVGAVVLSQVLKSVTGTHHVSFLVQSGLLVLGGVLLACVRIPPPVGARPGGSPRRPLPARSAP